MEIVTRMEVSDETLGDLLLAAIAYASSSWCTDMEVRKLPREYANCTSHVGSVILGPGGIIVFKDPEGDVVEGKVGKDGYYTVTRTKVKRGLEKMAYDSGRPREEGGIPSRHWDRILSGDWCDETADVFLQYCVLGEIVFG